MTVPYASIGCDSTEDPSESRAPVDAPRTDTGSVKVERLEEHLERPEQRDRLYVEEQSLEQARSLERSAKRCQLVQLHRRAPRPDSLAKSSAPGEK